MTLLRSLALVTALAAVTPVHAASDAAPAAPAAAPERRAKGKWPWFKRYRQAAPARQTPPPEAAPAPAPSPAPLAPAPRRRGVEPAEASAGPSPAASRRRARTARSAESPAPSAPAPAPPPAPRVGAPAALGVPLSRFHRSVRRELDIPASWNGAPPVAQLTSNVTAIRDIAPLQERLAAMPAGSADAALHVGLAGALLEAGLEAAAAAECLVALGLDPRSSPAWNDLSTVLRRAGAHGLAESSARQAIAADPSAGLPHFNLALLRDAQCRIEEAQAEYLRALELEPALWVPERNPLVVNNPRARAALHRLYLKRQASGPVLVDDSAGQAAPAP